MYQQLYSDYLGRREKREKEGGERREGKEGRGRREREGRKGKEGEKGERKKSRGRIKHILHNSAFIHLLHSPMVYCKPVLF